MPHLKRYATPPCYSIPVKVKKFAPVITGGGHPHGRAIPLRIILRDMLGYARNTREVKKILSAGKVIVDGVVRKDDRFGVGIMDVISLPDAGVHLRVLPRKEKLVLVEIPEKEANIKLCRIMNKTVVNGGHIQLNLHDGRNILIRVKDPCNPVEDVYKTMDSLLINLPDQKILKHIKMKEGKLAMIYRGKRAGEMGKVEKIEIIRGFDPNRITLQTKKGSVTSPADYVFVVGDETPEITIE